MKNLRNHLDKYERAEKFERFTQKPKITKTQNGKKMKPIQRRLDD